MISKDRCYRSFKPSIRNDDGKMIVEGYAVVFNNPTVMYEFDGIKYKEEIDRNAFNGCQMQDVVLNFNHGGKPFARTKNNTLQLTVDDYGLKIEADLSGTEEGRRTYEEVKGGYLDKMSFCFTINAEEYNREEHLRRITGIKRLFDVAIVDIPAYDTTSVNARNFFEVEAQRESAEALENFKLMEVKKRKLALKIKLLRLKEKEGKNNE